MPETSEIPTTPAFHPDDANRIAQAMSAGTATHNEVVGLIATSLGWVCDDEGIRSAGGLLIGTSWAAVNRRVNRFGGVVRDEMGALMVDWDALMSLEATLLERTDAVNNPYRRPD